MTTSNVRSAQPQHLRRQHDRSSVALPAIIETGSEKAGARLINIASGGALIQCSASFRPGESFLLRCGSIAVEAMIIWQKEDLFGIGFGRTLSDAELAEQLFRNRAVQSRKSLKTVPGLGTVPSTATNGQRRSANSGSNGGISAVALSQQHVEAAMGAMETIMAVELSDIGRFSSARLRLRQANLARTKAVLEACDQLMAMKPSQTQFRELQRQEIAVSQMVSEHVQSWPTPRLQDDWTGYCQATRKIFARVRELIAAEKSLLL